MAVSRRLEALAFVVAIGSAVVLAAQVKRGTLPGGLTDMPDGGFPDTSPDGLDPGSGYTMSSSTSQEEEDDVEKAQVSFNKDEGSLENAPSNVTVINHGSCLCLTTNGEETESLLDTEVAAKSSLKRLKQGNEIQPTLCSFGKKNQQFTYKKSRLMQNGRCLRVQELAEDPNEGKVVMDECDASSDAMWEIHPDNTVRTLSQFCLEMVAVEEHESLISLGQAGGVGRAVTGTTSLRAVRCISQTESDAGIRKGEKWSWVDVSTGQAADSPVVPRGSKFVVFNSDPGNYNGYYGWNGTVDGKGSFRKLSHSGEWGIETINFNKDTGWWMIAQDYRGCDFRAPGGKGDRGDNPPTKDWQGCKGGAKITQISFQPARFAKTLIRCPDTCEVCHLVETAAKTEAGEGDSSQPPALLEARPSARALSKASLLQTKQAGSCMDSDHTGIRFRGGARATCADLAGYCKHPTLSHEISVKCAATCGMCRVATVVPSDRCVDGETEENPVFTIFGKRQNCTAVAFFCIEHPFSDKVQRKCPMSCKLCAPKEEASQTLEAKLGDEQATPSTHIDASCSRRRRMGICYSRRRRAEPDDEIIENNIADIDDHDIDGKEPTEETATKETATKETATKETPTEDTATEKTTASSEADHAAEVKEQEDEKQREKDEAEQMRKEAEEEAQRKEAEKKRLEEEEAAKQADIKRKEQEELDKKQEEERTAREAEQKKQQEPTPPATDESTPSTDATKEPTEETPTEKTPTEETPTDDTKTDDTKTSTDATKETTPSTEDH